MTDTELIARATTLAIDHSSAGINGPFGAVIARDGDIIAEGWNSVVELNDPTAHAEIMAIRKACVALSTHDLAGYTIYASCEPCPMCLAAIQWARLDRVVFSCSRTDAAAAGFDDELILKEVVSDWPERTIPWQQLDRKTGLAAFKAWAGNPNRVMY